MVVTASAPAAVPVVVLDLTREVPVATVVDLVTGRAPSRTSDRLRTMTTILDVGPHELEELFLGPEGPPVDR